MSTRPSNYQFPKKCAFTSPANGAGLDAGGGPRPFYTAARRLIGRRRSEVRSLLVCGLLSLPSAYDPQDGVNPEPDRPLSRRSNSNGA
jgi:hypothetical protein